MVFEIQFAILKLFLSLFASSLPSDMSAAIFLDFFLSYCKDIVRSLQYYKVFKSKYDSIRLFLFAVRL